MHPNFYHENKDFFKKEIWTELYELTLLSLPFPGPTPENSFFSTFSGKKLLKVLVQTPFFFIINIVMSIFQSMVIHEIYKKFKRKKIVV